MKEKRNPVGRKGWVCKGCVGRAEQRGKEKKKGEQLGRKIFSLKGKKKASW